MPDMRCLTLSDVICERCQSHHKIYVLRSKTTWSEKLLDYPPQSGHLASQSINFPPNRGDKRSTKKKNNSTRGNFALTFTPHLVFFFPPPPLFTFFSFNTKIFLLRAPLVCFSFFLLFAAAIKICNNKKEKTDTQEKSAPSGKKFFRWRVRLQWVSNGWQLVSLND